MWNIQDEMGGGGNASLIDGVAARRMMI